MFTRKKEDAIENIDSLISENIKIIGKIEGKGNLRIDGVVEGDIDYDGNIIVGEDGKIKGNVKSKDISLAGTIEGNVNSDKKLVILPTGRLIGDLVVSSFVVHETAIFEGNCKMINDKVTELHSKEGKESKIKSKWERARNIT